MAKFADQKRRDADDLQVGQDVWLATKHLPLRGNARKLSAIWAGPFKVIEKVSSAAYKLALPEDWGIHNVFHVSQLKIVVGKVLKEQPIEVADGVEFEVESVLAQRVVRGRRQFLVKWLGYGDWENSWEPEENLANAQDKLK